MDRPAGADDYLVEPFALAESARARTRLRRGSLTGSSRVLTAQDLRLDHDARLATRNG